ncbi:MAG: hypothetical protein A3C84_04660 [Candidatus Ryanbacteria bacterium RIFCSPHIGHO2_02_FULL_48_12]|uniref:PEGA domain-containing protein n=1 Tax=Candidatus Ryanbacteria bacterium RIFCSPHIGHO2_01_FULL_48_27 TaxID=1802115 RepID=A0A1G2G609_9BACT|nr:MAG: hypothetical protein A2756_02140 [Candidatus Ryanbacteria bacterium RIFCSPHIGHO2_01_FULL_48_27]OGZ49870.1 MAG: hypothetical protein A3C84_04660 [Candidatus Ryanbacteria bacterium RIFCSPHIGHO2_02_FULL_48_12]
MTIRTRRVLVGASYIIFIAALGPILLYTFGYRLSPESWTLQKTGGFFVSTSPLNSRISLDGKFKKETSFISRGAFIQNLRPKSYTILVEKDGFWPWTKTLPTRPSAVTEARAVLVPRDPHGEIVLRGPFENMLTSPQGRFFLFTEKKNDQSYGLSFYNLRSGMLLTPASLQAKNLLEHINAIPGHISWASDETSAIVETKNDWIEITFNPEGTVAAKSLYATGDLRRLFKQKPRLVTMHPDDPQRIFILDGERLFIWHGGQAPKVPVLETIAGLIAEENNLVMLDSQSGLLYRTDLDGRAPQALSQEKIEHRGLAHIISRLDGYAVWSDAGLSMLDTNASHVQKISDEELTRAPLSSDTNIIWWSNGSLWIQWLASDEKLPYYQTERHEKLLQTERPISQVFLYPTEGYLVVAAGETVFVTELDGRNIRNTVNLYKGKRPQIFVPGDEKVVYILDDNILLKISLDTPFTPKTD